MQNDTSIEPGIIMYCLANLSQFYTYNIKVKYFQRSVGLFDAPPFDQNGIITPLDGFIWFLRYLYVMVIEPIYEFVTHEVNVYKM